SREPALVRSIRIRGGWTVGAEQYADSFLAACSQVGRDHKAVTAVVARPADDTERSTARRRLHRCDPLGRSLAGACHQRSRREARLRLLLDRAQVSDTVQMSAHSE